MSPKPVRFLKNQEIEELTEHRLRDYERLTSRNLEPPVPLGRMIVKLFGVSEAWDDIEEEAGETILGTLRPEVREIVLNARREELFKQYPGLERATQGHELGHWDLHTNEGALLSGNLFDDAPPSFYREAKNGRVVSLCAIAKHLHREADVYELLVGLEGREPSWMRRQAEHYAGCILVPRFLLVPRLRQVDLTQWPSIYGLAEQFGVSATLMKVRLCKLKLLVERDGALFTPDEAVGQKTLW